VEGFALFLGLLLVATGVMWGEAALAGRPKLRRYVQERGYMLRKARWRPTPWKRQAVFDVTLERDGQVFQGLGYVGGFWTGPVWSSRVEFDWGNGSLEDSLPSDHH
jgi:hypothetical protein